MNTKRLNCKRRIAPALPLILASLALVSWAMAQDRPNIVLILVDDMGYGDLNCQNPTSKIPTPNIDGLAEQGIRFTNAHAAGAWCVPSRYGLLTGRYPICFLRLDLPAETVDVNVHPTKREVAFLHEGDYTVAFTCHAVDDHPDTHEIIDFAGSANVSFAAGYEAKHNF